MLPIAAEIAVRLTREQAQSALPDAPVRPDRPERRRPRSANAGSRRMFATALRRIAASSGRLADRVDRPVGAR
ncbi:MAG: hypothetical protein ACRDOJ_09360 [Nocardioidaceae bacterium]